MMNIFIEYNILYVNPLFYAQYTQSYNIKNNKLTKYKIEYQCLKSYLSI